MIVINRRDQSPVMTSWHSVSSTGLWEGGGGGGGRGGGQQQVRALSIMAVLGGVEVFDPTHI